MGKNKTSLIILVAALGLLFIFGLIGGAWGLGLYAVNNLDNQESTPGNVIASEGLSAQVPPIFGSIFTEAEKLSGTPSALVAAIYLTEHHTDSFGKDLPTINATFQEVYGKSCTENGSGAAGPMQFIPASWSGVASKLKAAGISSPDRCKFRDSIIGAGFLLAGKANFDWVKEACKVGDDGKVVLTDLCISRWGQAYCGVGGCNNRACGAPKYLYCEEVVRKYKLVVGET